MTVADLIEALTALPLSAEVWLADGNDGYGTHRADSVEMIDETVFIYPASSRDN